MIEVRVTQRENSNSQRPTVPKRNIEVREKRSNHGSVLQGELFQHELDCSRSFLMVLNSLECSASVTCSLKRRRFRADGFVELWNPMDKPYIVDALETLMQIGAMAKHCNGSSFVLKLDQHMEVL